MPTEDEVRELTRRLYAGDFKAGLKLGDHYIDVKNYQAAIKTFNEVVKLKPDSDYALQRLGWLYCNKKDFAKAKMYLEKAIALDNTNAMFILAGMYFRGEILDKHRVRNIKEALKLYKQAADKGHVEAMFTLGKIYETGNGVAKDLKEALKWYEKADKHGHSRAKDKIDNILKCLEESSAKGNADATFTLGEIYETGNGVAEDLEVALKWYIAADKQGHPRAKSKINDVKRKIEQRKKAKAAAYKKLVEDVRAAYAKPSPERQSPKVKLLAPVVDGENICHEINFYTYWQGFGYAQKVPKIKYLLVSKEWGRLDTHQYLVALIQKMNAGESVNYCDASKPVDKNMIKLFEILGYDIMQRHDDLFFTNFSLGYRNGEDSGDVTKGMMMADAYFFRRLCDILEPKNILCLGQRTFECVYETLTGKSASALKFFNDKYGEFIEKHEKITARCGNVDTTIYPLADCGNTVINIHRNLDLQKADWQKIAADNGR